MTIEEAIQTAIQYEKAVRDVYAEAAKTVGDPKGRRVCEVLGQEEQTHLDYLSERLREWRKTGNVQPRALKTAVPSREAIAQAAKSAAGGVSAAERDTEMKMLGRALEAERKTSAFYRQMVAELSSEGQGLFRHFVEIEEGHVAIVQAEMDSLTGNGAWFDILEVKL